MKQRKKFSRRRLLIWLGADLLVAGVVALLLLHRPSGYRPAPLSPPDANGRQVDSYLSRELPSQFYNGAQRQRPFEMVILDRALSQAIAQLKWPQESGGVRLQAPQVRFAPGRIILMGTTNVEGADFVLTIEFGPRLDDQGKLNLVVEAVKVGAIPVTFFAKRMAKKLYLERISAVAVDMQDLRTKIAASLFNEEPFDPVLKVEDKWVRLKGLDLTEGRLIARFDRAAPPPGTTPAPNRNPRGK